MRMANCRTEIEQNVTNDYEAEMGNKLSHTHTMFQATIPVFAWQTERKK
jgi:hypothetical protein